MSTVVARGGDVSHFQQTLTKSYVKGWKFAAAKCTESNNFVDPHYSTNHSRARSYGLAFLAYHFARPEHSSGANQAAYFLSHARLKSGDGILLDLEASGVGQAATRAWRNAFLSYCRAHAPKGTSIHVYMGGGYCGNGTGLHAASYADRLWYPHYTVSGWASRWAPGFTSHMLSNTGFKQGPHVWQCADHPTFDHDVSRVTVTELMGGATPTPPKPQEDDVPSRDSFINKQSLPLPGNTETTIGWDTEIGDPDNFHTDANPSLLTGPAQYNADYQLLITGLAVGDAYEVGVYEKSKDAKGNWVVSSTPFQDAFVASPDASGVTRKSITVVGGYLPSGQHLHLAVKPRVNNAVLAAGSTAQVQYWKS